VNPTQVTRAKICIIQELVEDTKLFFSKAGFSKHDVPSKVLLEGRLMIFIVICKANPNQKNKQKTKQTL
jgi:hypothetical protein